MGTPWPLQGLPTWSFEGEHGTWTANILTPHSFSTDVIIEDYSPGITPLHVTASGIFTMSLTVPHGPCEYTDHMYFEIVEQSSSILPEQVECVNIDSDYRTFISCCDNIFSIKIFYSSSDSFRYYNYIFMDKV
jgi:hypothetical protein